MPLCLFQALKLKVVRYLKENQMFRNVMRNSLFAKLTNIEVIEIQEIQGKISMIMMSKVCTI